ncbi:bifunctional UDP-sugar hydrolase/5'-nucleotidase [Pseudactinotalea sp. HY158]|uniref:bifunctional metallophosphatase/5'-nucleotidase n=1 Tax=Pseudactinotalea sp. HY158 TaxID=2654547 RepID=UPI001E5C8B8F|nr:5'-nucleotidase C-terminal domain-containing protein [Pseudactinotalea sp. HY158]
MRAGTALERYIMRQHTAGGIVAAVILAGLAAAPAHAAPADGVDLTLLGTTDTHGHVYNWDYFANEQYTDQDDILGLTRVATYVSDVRDEVGAESVIVMDSGDAIQGTPLTTYYGLGDGAAGVLSGETEHPMSQAFKYIGYDTLGIGNHEFNYGLDMLKAYERDLDTADGGPTLLGANVIDVDTGEPWLEPYTIVEREIDGETVKVGVIGLVTPGVRVWDRKFVEGKLEFQDLVEAARHWVPIVAEEADVVALNVHSGKGEVPNEDYDTSALYENVVNNVAYLVPGIDYILFGHSHQDDPETIVTNKDGGKVLLTQPYYWARSVTRTTLHLVPDGDGWQVDWSEGNEPHAQATYGYQIGEPDEGLRELLMDKQTTTIDYVNTPVATSVTDLKSEKSRYEDTPIIDFINHVQLEAITTALGDVGDATIISAAAPFSRTAIFPEGDVTIRDIAGLYVFPNTLYGVELTGAQVRDYLEYSASYFVQVPVGADFDPATGTNAPTDHYPDGMPDYAYDAIAGVDYYIDISQDVGERITDLRYPDGTPVGDDDTFILALNNYRQSGGAGFPHVADAEIVYDGQQQIRQMLIDWAVEHEVIDPDDFFVPNWSLITEPIAEPTQEPTDTASPTEPASPTETGSPTDTGTSPSAGQTPGGSMPDTGAPVGPLAGTVALLLLAGAAVLAVRRRLA